MAKDSNKNSDKEILILKRCALAQNNGGTNYAPPYYCPMS